MKGGFTMRGRARLGLKRSCELTDRWARKLVGFMADSWPNEILTQPGGEGLNANLEVYLRSSAGSTARFLQLH